jgi:Flp pilus assembly pilin Flp
MPILRKFIICYGSDENGATAIEYGLIVAGIALAIAASVWAFGDSISTLLYDDLPTALSGS